MHNINNYIINYNKSSHIIIVKIECKLEFIMTTIICIILKIVNKIFSKPI